MVVFFFFVLFLGALGGGFVFFKGDLNLLEERKTLST